MAEQHENTETAGDVTSDTMVDSNTEPSIAPTVNASPKNLIGIERAPDLDHSGPIGLSTNPANDMAVEGAPENHAMQHQPEQNEVTTSPQETDKRSVIRTGAEETSMIESDPSEMLHHSTEEDALNGLTPDPQAPSEPDVQPSTSTGDPEPRVDAHSLNDASHTSELEPIAQSPLGEALRSDKGSDIGEPKVATSPVATNPTGNIEIHRHASPTSQDPTISAGKPGTLTDFTETETRVPVVNDAPQPSDPVSTFYEPLDISHEPLKLSHKPSEISHEPSGVSHEPFGAHVHTDNFMQETQAMREALPTSEASVAADPAAAIAAINNAATEIDRVMEQHHQNSNSEVEHNSGDKGRLPIDQPNPESETGSYDSAQHHGKSAPASVIDNSFATHPISTIQENPAPQTSLDAHQYVENEASRINPSLDHPRLHIHDPTEGQISHGTHQPLGVHEPMEDQTPQATDPPSNVHESTASQVEAATPTVQGPSAIPANIPETTAAYTEDVPADSMPADAEMDDGSSVSTIHAYLGAHAPSLGTGSVNGDFDDTPMDDGDSALGDDVESYV